MPVARKTNSVIKSIGPLRDWPRTKTDVTPLIVVKPPVKPVFQKALATLWLNFGFAFSQPIRAAPKRFTKRVETKSPNKKNKLNRNRVPNAPPKKVRRMTCEFISKGLLFSFFLSCRSGSFCRT